MSITPSTTFDATMSLVRAHVAKHPIAPEALPGFISNVHATLLRIAGDSVAVRNPAAPARPAPAVAPSDSVRHDRIVCLEDGTEHTMMKRYLMRKFGMTPQEYRAKWGLPAGYPMTAPGYSEAKRGEAMKVGLGTRANKAGRSHAAR